MPSAPEPETNDVSDNLTEPAYWDKFWKSPFGSSATRLSHYYWLLSRKLATYAPAGSRAIELGCGGSVWLPTLARRGVDSWGIDYSDVGVKRANDVLARWGEHATVVRGDVFDRESLPESHFDLVYSMGLLEHFSDGDAYVARLWDLTKPGGHVLTTVPNLGSRWGQLQKAFDRDIFDAHRLYTPADLDGAHVRRGFDIVERAAYFGGIYPLFVDYSPVTRRLPAIGARAFIGAVWLMQQSLGWSMAPLPQSLKNPASLAGHILAVYRKPAAGA